jgi:integrase
MGRKTQKVSIVMYARLPEMGWRRGSVIIRNGKTKHGYMSVAGVEYPVENPSYQIRTYIDSKAVYETIGSDYNVALEKLEQCHLSRQRDEIDRRLGIYKPTEPKPKPKPEPKKSTEPTMAELVEAYIKQKSSPSLKLSDTTIRHYNVSLSGFVKLTSRRLVTDVTMADIVAYMDDLTKQGYSQKSRVDRYTIVRGFLRNSGVNVEKLIDKSVHSRFAAKPEGDTSPYTQEQLDRLFAVCDVYHHNVFMFLLATGLRYRELNHLTWADVDMTRWVITLPRERKTNRKYRDRQTGKMVSTAVVFETKSRRKREIPIFPSLRPMLLDWREKHPNTVFVFGSKRSDMPDNHWLLYLKTAWKRAGLNCGVCDGCKKKACEEAFLHRFRHTFAHRCLDGGIGIHKVSAWLGHHDISTTQIYLSNASTDADCDPFANAA